MTNIITPEYIMRDSPFGRLLIAGTGQGICYAALADTDRQLLPDLYADFPTAQPAANGVVAGWADALAAYLSGAVSELNLALDLRGTPFQQKVWKALCQIPRGETQTYAWLAQAIDSPQAARAVGHACGGNRVAVLVPCHRIIRGDGALGGYRWGLDRKLALLVWESQGQVA